MNDNVGNGSVTAQNRFSGGVSAYRQSRRDSAETDGELLGRHDGSPLPTRSPGLTGPGLESTNILDRAAKLPALDLQLSEPVFSGGAWADATPSTSMADHPLLRGLLLELPARGTMPPAEWLDRWFEAARSILELLYVQEARK